MGEYMALADGETVKLGTLEDLYYTTYDQLRAAVAAGATREPGNLEPAAYLDPAHGFRYRFPFPDEKGARIGGHDPYNRGVTVRAPTELAPAEHGEVGARVGSIGCRREVWDAFALTVRMGCPLDPDPVKRPATYQDAQPAVQVVQQKQVEGRLWTVLRCPYCGEQWRIDQAEAARLVEHLRREYAPDRFTLELADAIERGYAVEVGRAAL